MACIKSFLTLSTSALSVNGIYTTPEEFSRILKSVSDEEYDSCLRHFIIQNTPFVFQTYPILYGQIVKYLSITFAIEIEDIKLIGSAKTGFSISSPPNYGKPFDKGDLDFVIVNAGLFDKLKSEFKTLQYIFNENNLKLSAKNHEYWIENIFLIPKNFNRGFIDCNKIPNVSEAPLTRNISTTLWLIQDRLKLFYNIEIKKPSIRVYKDKDSFIKVLKFNTDTVLNKLA